MKNKTIKKVLCVFLLCISIISLFSIISYADEIAPYCNNYYGNIYILKTRDAAVINLSASNNSDFSLPSRYYIQYIKASSCHFLE